MGSAQLDRTPDEAIQMPYVALWLQLEDYSDSLLIPIPYPCAVLRNVDRAGTTASKQFENGQIQQQANNLKICLLKIFLRSMHLPEISGHLANTF